eukprot:g3975.t1
MLKHLIVALSLSAVAKLNAAEKPNILFIFTDDQSYETIGAHGLTDIDTPNLDRLVKEGASFEKAYNMGSWVGAVCMASRAGMNTGAFLWKAETAAREVAKGERPAWSQRMSAAGYETYMTGKWHVAGVSAPNVFDHTTNVKAGMPKAVPGGYNRPKDEADYEKGWKPWDKKNGGFWEGGLHWSELQANDAISYLEDTGKSGKPFFLYLAFNAPHDPRQAPREYIDMYPLDRIKLPENFMEAYPDQGPKGVPVIRDEKLMPFPRTEYSAKVNRQEYYALITHMDAQIGRVLDSLEATGQAGNTYIIMTADHGLSVGHHGLVGKQNMYEDAVCAPFIVWGPGIAPGRKIDAPIYLQDAMATALDIAGVENMDDVDYKSVMPLLRGEVTKTHDRIYGAYIDTQRMILKDDWKIIVYPKLKPEKGSIAETKRSLDWTFTPDPALPNVLILGDSISIGYTLDVRAALEGVANVYRPVAKDGKRPENCSGTINGVKNIDRWLSMAEWDVIHFNWGLHDLKHVKTAGTHEKSNNPNDPTQATVEVYAENMKTIVDKLKATGARLVFATTTPVVEGTLDPLRTPEAPVTYNTAAVNIMKANDIRMPEFSWDTLPLYMHLRKDTAFTEEEFRFLAKFPLITLEKSTGHKTYGSTDAGTLEAAKGIKALNPDAKILYYRNVLVHYGGNSFDGKLEHIPGWSLEGKGGEHNLVRSKLRAYDLSNPALRDWWVESMAGVCRSPYIDGLFLDGNLKALLPAYLGNQLPPGKKEETIAGYHTMMKSTREALGDDKLMLGNIIRARFENAGLEFIDYFDGSYLEGFTSPIGKTSRADYIAKGIAAVQKAARDGNIIALTLSLGNTDVADGVDETRGEAGEITGSNPKLRERLDFCIALYLVMAEKYSYLMVTDGYGVDPDPHGKSRSKLWLHTFPEYDRPLGAPQAPAVKDGYRYTREFQHVSVSLDIENMSGTLEWK